MGDDFVSSLADFSRGSYLLIRERKWGQNTKKKVSIFFEWNFSLFPSIVEFLRDDGG